MIQFKKKAICKTSKNMLSKVVQHLDVYKSLCEDCPDKNECEIYPILQSYGTGVYNWESIENILQEILEKKVSIDRTCKNRVKRDDKVLGNMLKNTPGKTFK